MGELSLILIDTQDATNGFASHGSGLESLPLGVSLVRKSIVSPWDWQRKLQQRLILKGSQVTLPVLERVRAVAELLMHTIASDTLWLMPRSRYPCKQS
jgi:hypothetical protein